MGEIDTLARELARLNGELESLRADAAAGYRELAVAIRRSRLNLTRAEQLEAERKLRPPTTLLNWTPREGQGANPDIDASLIARLRRGNAVADSLGNTDVFAGTTNRLLNPLLDVFGNFYALTTGATIWTHDWYGYYTNVTGSPSAPTIRKEYARGNVSNSLNSNIIKTLQTLVATTPALEQHIYVYQDVSLPFDLLYPYLVGAVAVAGHIGTNNATVHEATLEWFDTVGGVVRASSPTLDLKTFSIADGARRLTVSLAGWQTYSSMRLRLKIRTVGSTTLTAASIATYFGDPTTHFAWSPDAAAYSPSLGAWIPNELYTYEDQETQTSIEINGPGIYFNRAKAGGGIVSITHIPTAGTKAINLNTGGQLRAQGLTAAIPEEYPCSAPLTLSTTETDIAGCTVTYTPKTAETVLVTGIFDCQISTPSTSVAQGRLVVDGGAAEPAEALGRLNGGTDWRGTVTQSWIVNLTRNTSHTLKLRGLKTAAGGALVFNNVHTKMILERYITDTNAADT